MKLYDITKNMQGIEQMLADGVDPDQLVDALGDVTDAFEEKAGGILFLMQNMSADIEAFKIEEARLAKRRKSAESQIAHLKGYLILNMSQSGITKLDNGVIKASITKARQMLVLTDGEKVPGDYKTVTTSSAIDKKQLLAALKEGKEIDGCEIGQSKIGLSIK